MKPFYSFTTGNFFPESKNNLLLFIGIFSFALWTGCVAETKEDRSPAFEETFSAEWKYQPGEGTGEGRMEPAYDDSEWQTAYSNQTLADQELTTGNGFGWYRKTIYFGEEMQQAIRTKGAIVVKTGRLAAADEVWFNGRLIGKTGEFPPDYQGYNDHERKYLVTKDYIHPDGENVIAIKFHDGWGRGGFLEDALLKITTADTNDKIDIIVDVADEDYIFMSPAPLEITVTIDNKNEWPVTGSLVVSLLTDEYLLLKKDSLFTKIKGQESITNTYTFTSPAPGFYRYQIQFTRDGEIIAEKKFNVGYEPEEISSPVDAKADLREFWDQSLKELAAVSPRYKLTLQPEYSQIDYDIYLVEMFSFGNELIRGYYGKPKKEGKHPVIVEYMGYGSSPYPPNQWYDGFAYFVLSIRGQALNQPENKYGTWITYGLDNKEDYYYRGAFMDVIRALDFVCSRPEIDSEKIAVRGGSQGGALSFVAAALDNRVKAAAPNIPFLSDYRDYFKITHWPREDFERYKTAHPDVSWDHIYDLLTYFDIKNLAPWIQCPLIMGIGVQDEVCPPHINFAAYNQVPSEKVWMAFPEFGHSVGKVYNDAAMAFIKEKLDIQ